MTAQAEFKDDLLDPELVHDPYPHLARLREEDPVHYSAAHRSWLVTRYDDVAAGMGDLRLSSDRVKPLLAAMSDEKRAKSGGALGQIAEWMVVSDPPAHTRLRKLATNAFHPRKVVAMEDRIREIVDDALGRFIASGDTDIVAGFAFPLPATIISELIGAPYEDADRFSAWSDDLALVAFGAGGARRDDRHARAQQSIAEMFEYFQDLLEVRRADPGTDMISDLLAGVDGLEPLSDDEITSMCALMLFAGHETTQTTITSAVKLLLEHPDQRALLEADPKMGGKVVEEVLRVEGAIKVLHRWVIEDVEIGGRSIPEGDRVLLVPAAANRDPRKFDRPDEFDVTRQPNPHLAFGKGIHTCIGAMLARIEMRVAVARMVERLPGLRFAVDAPELEWMPSLASRGLVAMHVEHDAR